MQQQVRLSLRCTLWRCFRRTRLICWKTWIRLSIKSRYEPEQPGVLAHLGLGIRDGLRRLVSPTHAPPPPAGRAKERHGSERGKTWGRCSGWSVLYDTFVRTRVRHLLLSLRGASALLILSNSPATNGWVRSISKGYRLSQWLHHSSILDPG